MTQIKKLLVANRGEIAVRVIKAAREMGLRSVAVYSDADRTAAHARIADEAIHLGASEPANSYLNLEKILDAAKNSGADAIHPGYGFLSERAELSEACDEAGFVFVGPPAAAMRRLGSKIAAKTLAVEAGVPVVPGYFEPGATARDLAEAAEKIGYPVMLKASAGGGGRGMRVVRKPDDFVDEYRIASDEAEKAFGDGAMMVEKLIERPRHIEAQILADAHGNVATLFERECSLQRRHQKLLEESPSPIMPGHPELWPRMSDAARSLARLAGYVGAGTVEFIVDPATGQFYFLEVNARLQVEHPVTEMVTGLDLVQWQIRIARGETLDIEPGLMIGERNLVNGHSIEARVIAEDPARDFLPSSGRLLAWAAPSGPGIRVDTGYGPESEVPRYYDSLLAKVIVHADDRPAAIRRLRGALEDFHILGVRTNIAYLLDILAHPGFAVGEIDTGFLGREFAEWSPGLIAQELGEIAASAVSPRSQTGELATLGAWATSDGFRNARGSIAP
jgi:acetyl/propionyl-CoA carboxylase alpha subunit